MKNLDKREVLGTHVFGSGLKYLEQWFTGALYTALMVLLTDTSSLGDGGGDFRLSKAPEKLKKMYIEPVIGLWAGNRIVFSGDYTRIKEYEESDAPVVYYRVCVEISAPPTEKVDRLSTLQIAS